MEFNPTTLFILPNNNTLPSSGTTSDLTASQFGVFRADYSVATAGNIAGQKYIYLAQGRNVALPGVGTKRSDKIALGNVIEWYKVPSISTYSPEVYQISNFTVQGGEAITFTFRAHSSYIDTGFFNGLQRSVTVQAPCLACNGDPCANIDPTALIDKVISKAQADVYLNKFFSFQRIGSGSNTVLQVTSKPLDIYQQPCDVAAYPYEYDRIWYRVFVQPGAATTQDFQVYDPCNQAATVTLIQRSTYPSGSSAEVTQLEKNYYSYQALHKHLFRNPIYNNAFATEVISGQYYDIYVLRFSEYQDDVSFSDKVLQSYIVMLAVPTGQTSTLETLLTAYFGAPASKVVTVPTTTSTTSTSSTSTSTTTTLEP